MRDAVLAAAAVEKLLVGRTISLPPREDFPRSPRVLKAGMLFEARMAVTFLSFSFFSKPGLV